ncbi:MAG: glycosyltransferase family 2 protein [Thermodesulfovibrionales bacterium]|nr:glycosyltransferase family 2 protein [Thermodesulfovibrionales bacterium]
MKASVVMPVFNEIHTIDEIISRVLVQKDVSELIIVDDYSSDGTRQRLQNYIDNDKIKIIFHDKNKGKGAALRSGFSLASGDIIIVQDADLEYDPADYPALLKPILDGKADVVFGSRFLGGPHRVLYFWHYIGNRFLTTLSNMFNNINLTDMEVCYKVFKREILNKITLKCDRFGFEPEFTAKVAKLKLRIYEVPVSYYGRTYAEGKKITWKDGIAALWWIVRFGLFK